jgi:CubicO group peptidase (beta-lactamase class C family)
MRCICVLVVLIPVVVAQETRDLPAPVCAAIAKAAEAERKTKAIPAITVAVGRNGKVRYAGAFGLLDLENDVKATPNTRFRTASIAKSMTAVAVMQLAEKGKLDLDADIRDYVPQWPQKKWKMTARQLLAHLGGVRHYQRPGESSGTKFYTTLGSTLELFQDDPLVAEPGTRFSYTTYGYTLLGLAVEKASGQLFQSYMGNQVWSPAEMKYTLPDVHHLVIKNRARGYTKLDRRRWMLLPEFAKKIYKPGMIFNADLHDTTMKVPGGGFLSTSPDLVRFGLSMLSDKLVSRKTREAIWTRQKTASGEEIRYGLGWNVGVASGQRLIAHSGSQSGTSTYLAIMPDSGLVVACMSNLTGIGMRDLTGTVMKAVLAGG